MARRRTRQPPHPRKRRRLRGLALLGGLALGAWTYRNRKIAENERTLTASSES